MLRPVIVSKCNGHSDASKTVLLRVMAVCFLNCLSAPPQPQHHWVLLLQSLCCSCCAMLI